MTDACVEGGVAADAIRLSRQGAGEHARRAARIVERED
jgi:hypothetical protein